MSTTRTMSVYDEPEVIQPVQLRGIHLPEDWRWEKLGEICKTTSGGTPSRSVPKYFDGNIPWVKSGELPDGIVTEIEEHITEEAIRNSSAKLFPAGTLLIALYGATVGKLGVLSRNATTNQAVCGIFPPDSLDRKYLSLVFAVCSFGFNCAGNRGSPAEYQPRHIEESSLADSSA